jgi:hypothetical protein
MKFDARVGGMYPAQRQRQGDGHGKKSIGEGTAPSGTTIRN